MSRTTIEKNISYDEERKLYYVTLNWGKDASGRYVKKSKTTSSKREARQILSAHKKKMGAGIAVAPVKETLADVLEAYLQYKELKLAKTTIYGYRNILSNHVKPYFKEQQIQFISLQDIQNYVVFKSQSGLSMNSIKKHLELLRSVFEDARRKQIISVNPIDLLERNRIIPQRNECLNASEIAALCASVVDTKLELPVVLAAYLGLRRGEVLGLRWRDIDFNMRLLHVVNTRTKAGGDIIEKEPKTEKSRRVLKMPNQVIAVLQKAQKRQKEMRLTHRRYQESEYIFTKDDGTPFKPNYLSDCFRQHLKKNGMRPVRFHDLRHSFASIANGAGVPMMEISSTMGHANMGVTSSVYTHEFAREKEAAVNAVAIQIAQANLTAQG